MFTLLGRCGGTSKNSYRVITRSEAVGRSRDEELVHPLPDFRLGDLILGSILSKEGAGTKKHPFRARFVESEKRGGYSFVYEGVYEKGVFEVQGDRIVLLRSSQDPADIRGELRVRPVAGKDAGHAAAAAAEAAPDADASAPSSEAPSVEEEHWVEGWLSVRMSQRGAIRPRFVQQVDVLTLEAKLVRQGLDLQPGGGLARSLMIEHVVVWCSVTLAGLIACCFSSCDHGTPSYVYFGYLPLLVWHVCRENQLYRKYLAPTAGWSCAKLALQHSYSVTERYDVFTDTIFVVLAMQCSAQITPAWVQQWVEMPILGPWCAVLAGRVGFGEFCLIVYLALVLFPQGVLGFWSCWRMQRHTLSTDKAGESVEEDILALQDVAANASFYALETAMNEYVNENIEEHNVHDKEISSEERARMHDDTMHTRVFKRVFMAVEAAAQRHEHPAEEHVAENT